MNMAVPEAKIPHLPQGPCSPRRNPQRRQRALHQPPSLGRSTPLPSLSADKSHLGNLHSTYTAYWGRQRSVAVQQIAHCRQNSSFSMGQPVIGNPPDDFMDAAPGESHPAP